MKVASNFFRKADSWTKQSGGIGCLALDRKREFSVKRLLLREYLIDTETSRSRV